MILDDNEVITRLGSPLNLINRLRGNSSSKNAMDLFIPNESHRYDESSAAISDESIKSILESIKEVEDSNPELIPDEAAKIKLGIVKAQAIDVLHDSILELGRRLPEVQKVRDLASIARDMKSIASDETENSKRGNTNVVVYKPITNDISKYDTLVVVE